MVVDHTVAAAKALAKVCALIAWTIRTAEVVVAIRIGWPMGIDVVARSFNAVVETTVPCVRPATFRLVRLPGSSWRALLGVNCEGGATGQCQPQYKSSRVFCDSHCCVSPCTSWDVQHSSCWMQARWAASASFARKLAATGATREHQGSPAFGIPISRTRSLRSPRMACSRTKAPEPIPPRSRRGSRRGCPRRYARKGRSGNR
jgi:hypothetical protein